MSLVIWVRSKQTNPSIKVSWYHTAYNIKSMTTFYKFWIMLLNYQLTNFYLIFFILSFFLRIYFFLFQNLPVYALFSRVHRFWQLILIDNFHQGNIVFTRQIWELNEFITYVFRQNSQNSVVFKSVFLVTESSLFYIWMDGFFKFWVFYAFLNLLGC